MASSGKTMRFRLSSTQSAGLLFFVGLLVLPVWYGLRNYLSDVSIWCIGRRVGLQLYWVHHRQLVLSQKENHMLIFSLLAIVIVLNHEYARKRVPVAIGPENCSGWDQTLDEVRKP